MFKYLTFTLMILGSSAAWAQAPLDSGINNEQVQIGSLSDTSLEQSSAQSKQVQAFQTDEYSNYRKFFSTATFATYGVNLYHEQNQQESIAIRAGLNRVTSRNAAAVEVILTW